MNNRKSNESRYDTGDDVEMNNADNFNPNTMIRVQPGKEMGIDFSNFNSQMDETVHTISQSNDLPISQEVMDQHQSFKGILGKRMNSLRMIASSWAKGDRDGAFTAVAIMKDPSVSNDFFNFAFIKNDPSKVYLKYDHSILIMPLLISMINSKYDVYFKNGIKTAWMILKMYYDTIIQAKGIPNLGGVDLSREEKLNKFNTIITYFEKIKSLERIEKVLKSQTQNDDFNVQQFVSELDYFLKNCKKAEMR